MSRAVLTGTAVAALIAAVGGAFIVDPARMVGSIHLTILASAKSVGAPIYYRDPDGKPFYSLNPKTTEDGRAYHPVPPVAT
jgi:Cu(I)/Ag(I) efflux system membrane fusion protein